MAKEKQDLLRPDEPQTWDDFLNYALRELFDGLLTGGTKEMRSKLHMMFSYFLQWYPAFEETNKRRRT